MQETSGRFSSPDLQAGVTIDIRQTSCMCASGSPVVSLSHLCALLLVNNCKKDVLGKLPVLHSNPAETYVTLQAYQILRHGGVPEV